MVAHFNLQLGTLGEMTAAVAGGAALILALLGWKIATAANRDQAEFIRAELERQRIELEDRESRLQDEAPLVEFNLQWTNVQEDGSMRVEAEHEALAFYNGSGRPLRWLDIELTGDDGVRVEGGRTSTSRPAIARCSTFLRLPPAGTLASKTSVDTSGYATGVIRCHDRLQPCDDRRTRSPDHHHPLTSRRRRIRRDRVVVSGRFAVPTLALRSDAERAHRTTRP